MEEAIDGFSRLVAARGIYLEIRLFGFSLSRTQDLKGIRDPPVDSVHLCPPSTVAPN